MARWVWSQTPRTAYKLPTWIEPNLFGVYILDIGGLPVPVSLVPSDCTIAKWSYCPALGSVRWYGDFDCTTVWGQWFLEMVPSYANKAHWRSGIKSLDASLNAEEIVSDWTSGDRSDELNSFNILTPNENAYNGGSERWFVSPVYQWYGIDYAKLRDTYTQNAYDLHPDSWTAPEDPWE